MNKAWWLIEHYHIRSSSTVSVHLQDYKTAGTPCFGGFHGETSDLFPRLVFLGIWDLAMI